ncbi:hypothetical protein SDC9_149257 [bioreactor metagenome]|uniref:Uncharacterized protein n=1 Tax=bioreactor metagenome TaxID=1076179 RepID=A0A645EN18_9ZZZZ
MPIHRSHRCCFEFRLRSGWFDKALHLLLLLRCGNRLVLRRAGSQQRRAYQGAQTGAPWCGQRRCPGKGCRLLNAFSVCERARHEVFSGSPRLVRTESFDHRGWGECLTKPHKSCLVRTFSQISVHAACPLPQERVRKMTVRDRMTPFARPHRRAHHGKFCRAAPHHNPCRPLPCTPCLTWPSRLRAPLAPSSTELPSTSRLCVSRKSSSMIL